MVLIGSIGTGDSGFYPDHLPTKDWFSHYAKSFRTMEFNAPFSFYSWPTSHTVKAWLRHAKDKDFVYTVKASELITHVNKFRCTKTLAKDSGFIADVLGQRMGCFLFQLPPGYFRLKSILGQFERSRRNVVEFRHRS